MTNSRNHFCRDPYHTQNFSHSSLNDISKLKLIKLMTKTLWKLHLQLFFGSQALNFENSSVQVLSKPTSKFTCERVEICFAQERTTTPGTNFFIARNLWEKSQRYTGDCTLKLRIIEDKNVNLCSKIYASRNSFLIFYYRCQFH